MIIATPPGREDLKLYRAAPSSGLNAFLQSQGREDVSPYWAFAWGGGLALAQHLKAQPEIVAGRRVLDLGCGSGLVAIAAMQAGAARVLAVDVDDFALAATRLNAALNGVEVEVAQIDLLGRPTPERIDVVLIGDVFYEHDLAERVLAFARRCRDAGLDVLIGDPGREPLPTAALTRIGEPPSHDFGGGIPAGGVYVLATSPWED